MFEAAKTSAPGCAPGYAYYTVVQERIDANRACLSQARRIVGQPAAPSTIAR
jgi:transposase